MLLHWRFHNLFVVHVEHLHWPLQNFIMMYVMPVKGPFHHFCIMLLHGPFHHLYVMYVMHIDWLFYHLMMVHNWLCHNRSHLLRTEGHCWKRFKGKSKDAISINLYFDLRSLIFPVTINNKGLRV